MSRVDRIPPGGAFEAVCGPDLGKSPPPAAGKAANGNRRPADRPPSGRPNRSDWLETKLKCLYDEVANERLPPSLQKLIDDLDR